MNRKNQTRFARVHPRTGACATGKEHGVSKVDAAPGVIHISFKPNPPFDAMRIIELVQKNKHIKLAGNDRLRIERDLPEPKARAQMVRDVLRSLGTPIPPTQTASTETTH